jgi:hypothetical protein
MKDDSHMWAEELAKMWKEYTPPSRPSKSEMEIYEKYFRAVPKGGSVLVLGSTAEFRDLAARYKLRIVLCDWSEKNMEALGLLMKEKPHKEELSKRDWRDMDFPEKFDLIVGDAAFTVIPFEDGEKVAGRVASLLKENGVAVQRIWVRHGDHLPDDREIAEAYKKKPKGMGTYEWMLFPVFMRTYHLDEEYGKGTEACLHLKEAVADGALPKSLYEGVKFLELHNAKTNIPRKEKLEKVLGNYFRIERIEYGNDHFSKMNPIYVLRKV